MSPLLEVSGLSKSYGSHIGCADVGLELYPGEVLGIVGESGSGKTMTGRAVLGLIRPPGIVTARRMDFDGIDLTKFAPPLARPGTTQSAHF